MNALQNYLTDNITKQCSKRGLGNFISSAFQYASESTNGHAGMPITKQPQQFDGNVFWEYYREQVELLAVRKW